MLGFGCTTRKKIKSFTEKPERRPDGKIKDLHWILICVSFLFIEQIFMYHLMRVSKVIILTVFFSFCFFIGHILTLFSVYYDVHWGPFYLFIHIPFMRWSLCIEEFPDWVYALSTNYIRYVWELTGNVC